MTDKPGKRAQQSREINHESELLSQREIEILKWAAYGKTSGEISTILSISEITVKSHIDHAGKKLNTTNKTHTVATAVARGLIKL
jgi:LuxR family transcriptional regulator